MREFLREADNPELSRFAVLREAKTHVVGPMCHVLWRFTTGDAFGANMMTCNAYALNMAYVLPRAVPIERSILEANMGGDKKPSFEYFQQGHGKTVIAEVTLTEAAIERVLRTTRTDLEELAWAGTHGAVASGMQSVAFTPASAIAAVRGDGPGSGLVGTSSMAHGTEQRVEGGLHASIRFPGIEVGTVGGGTTLPDPKRWLELMGCAGPGRSTAWRSSWPRRRSRSRSAPPRRWRPQGARTSSAPTSSAAGCGSAQPAWSGSPLGVGGRNTRLSQGSGMTPDLMRGGDGRD
jgi:hydroxymethylglutaryl-CoA reductase